MFCPRDISEVNPAAHKMISEGVLIRCRCEVMESLLLQYNGCCLRTDIQNCKTLNQLTSPSISFNNVDFPAPLGPTSATLVSRSTPKSRFLYTHGRSGAYRKLTPCTMITGGGIPPQSGNEKETTWEPDKRRWEWNQIGNGMEWN